MNGPRSPPRGAEPRSGPQPPDAGSGGTGSERKRTISARSARSESPKLALVPTTLARAVLGGGQRGCSELVPTPNHHRAHAAERRGAGRMRLHVTDRLIVPPGRPTGQAAPFGGLECSEATHGWDRVHLLPRKTRPVGTLTRGRCTVRASSANRGGAFRLRPGPFAR
jgi:hypothetical protein